MNRVAWLLLSKMGLFTAFQLGSNWLGLLGATAAPRCEGTRFELLTTPGGRAPYIELQVSDKRGAFLVDYGATYSSVSAAVFSGTSLSLPIALPAFPVGQFAVMQYTLATSPPGGQLGILGTDFLSLLTADFVFRDGGGDVVLGSVPCDEKKMRDRGMVPIAQTGFFSSEVSRIDAGRPNVPVVYLRIGNVRTWAQIDTGYEDGVLTPSIDINDALHQQLTQSGVAIEVDRAIATATCAGNSTQEAGKPHGTKVTIETEAGTVLGVLDEAWLIRKAPNGCGGIAAMATPAAQIGISVLARFRQVVFDPWSERVWVLPTPSGK